jgi:hypothetical protein
MGGNESGKPRIQWHQARIWLLDYPKHFPPETQEQQVAKSSNETTLAPVEKVG